MNFFKGIVLFLGGAVVGGAAAYVYTARKANERADQEIKELQEYYANRKQPEATSNKEPVSEVPEQAPITNIINITKNDEPESAAPKTEEEYTDYTNYAKTHAIDKTKYGESPFQILTDQEYVQSDRDKVTLDYYEEDGILVNVDAPADDIYEDVDQTIGQDALKHFGEYEVDFVFVRNNRQAIDYEVCRHRESWGSKTGLDEGPQDG